MDFAGITECRWKLKGILITVLLLSIYFAMFFKFSGRMRYVLIAGLLMSGLFFLRPRPASWIPILPLLFAAGGSTIPLGDFNPSVSTLLMLIFTSYYFIDRLIWNKPLFVPSKPLFMIFLAFIIQVVSVFISIHVLHQYPWNAIRDGSSIFLFSSFVLMIPAMYNTENGLRRLHRAVVMTVLIASIIGVLQYFALTSFSRIDMNIGYLYKGRIASLFGNPNIFAGFLELGIPPSIALAFLDRDLKWKLISISAIALGSLSILYTFSRGGLIMTFLGSVAILVYIFRKRIWIPVFVGILAFGALLMTADIFERQMSFVLNPAGQMNQPTILHRVISYRGYINQFKETPIAGVGYGAEEHYWSRSGLYSFWEVRYARSFDRLDSFGGLNSLVLNNLVKGGLISLTSVILIFVAIFYAGFRIMKEGGGILPVGFLAGFVAFSGHQLMDNQVRFPTVNSFFWFNTGILLAYMILLRKKNATQSFEAPGSGSPSSSS